MRRSFKHIRLFAAGGLAVFFGSINSATAGDVRVALEGSLLKVTGSGTADTISIVQTAVGDIFVTAGTGTTISGRPSTVLRRVNLNAVEVRMEGGNDSVTTRGLNIANDLYVDLGAGNDRFVTSGPIFVGNNFMLEGQSGSDTVSLNAAEIAQDCTIDGGLGVLNATVIGLRGGKSLAMIADDANDVITIANTIVADLIAIETKGGNNRVFIDGASAFGVSVATGLGNDVLEIENLMADESLGFFTGPGNDTILLSNVVTTTTLTVSVDEGDDRVTGQAVVAGTDAVFEGGNGFDRLIDQGIEGGIKLEIKEFESVEP